MSVRSWAIALVSLGAACQTPPKPPPPEPGPSIKSFTTSATRVNRGQPITLTFETERAVSASIIDQQGQAVAVAFDDASQKGSATTTPQASAFYVLRVESPNGRDAAFVQVAVDEVLRSVFLVAVPQTVKAGQPVDVIWSASGSNMPQLTSEGVTLSSMASGTLSVRPTRDTTFELRAKNSLNQELMASATITVDPVIEQFEATPRVAQPGQVITLSWRTAGADRVLIEEATFGQLWLGAAELDGGSFAFTVPNTFGDGGVAMMPDAGLTDGGAGSTDGGRFDAGTPKPPSQQVREGYPLSFKLTASGGVNSAAATETLVGRVGQGALIDRLTAPAAVSSGSNAAVAWETTNAHRIELFVNGVLALRPPPQQLVDSTFTLTQVTSNLNLRLVAYDAVDVPTEQSVTIVAVGKPVITNFNLPMSVASVSNPATATWSTQHAAVVVIRIKDGPVVFSTKRASDVAMGSVQLAVALNNTYVLEAYNLANEKVTAERAVAVGTPVTLAVTPSPTAVDSDVLLSWDVGALAPLDLQGLPPLSTTPIAVNSQAQQSFIDLTQVPGATRVTFSSADDAVTELKLPEGFVFPFVNRMVTTAYISTNGFLAFPLSGAPATLSTNADLEATTYTGPPMLAPFWDDLTISGLGSTWWFLDDSTSPRRLIVQWDKASIDAEAGAMITFQVQLWETGKFAFLYTDPVGTQASGANATIGVTAGPGIFSRSFRFNTTGPVINSGDELVWFSGETTRLADSSLRKVSSSVNLGFFVELSTGVVPITAHARVILPNEIIINEAMPVPTASAPMGRWVELFNPGNTPFILDGLQLWANSSMAPHSFTAADTLMPGGLLLVGDSTDMQMNGGAPVQSTWPAGTMAMTLVDTVELRFGGTRPDGGVLPAISRLDWAMPDSGIVAVEGASVQPGDATLPPITCPTTATYGTVGLIGTPGATNQTCFDYVLSSIPVAFEDISSTTPLALTSGSGDEGIYQTAPPSPAFSYFGTPATQMSISSNGWLAFTATTSATLTNRITPSATASPKGFIAVFWDDLDMRSGGSVHVARRGDKTIVQWNRALKYGDANSLLTFEAKLFDDGAVEYHYAEMTTAANADNAKGLSATIWLEKPDGTSALPVLVNQPKLSPNSAWRFTPRAASTTP